MKDKAYSSTHQLWLNQALQGDREALGKLLDSHRAYLSMLARSQIHQRLQSKVDASDIVQEVSMVAQQQLLTFRGSNHSEFTGWLRGILANLIAKQIRRFLGTNGRDVRLEQSLQIELDHASASIERTMTNSEESPSQVLIHHESMLELADALEELSHDYRTVILFRNIEGLSFPEIAAKMNRSVDSVEKLWIRGLNKLKTHLAKVRES